MAVPVLLSGPLLEVVPESQAVRKADCVATLPVVDVDEPTVAVPEAITKDVECALINFKAVKHLAQIEVRVKGLRLVSEVDQRQQERLSVWLLSSHRLGRWSLWTLPKAPQNVSLR